jgi:trans-2-enoyl-CoA reductase
LNDLILTSQFDQLFGSEILTKEDLRVVSGLKHELINTLKKTQIHRTRTEMEVSVLNDVKHPTPASKYWQALREQGVMFNELVMLSFEYRKKQVEVKILERKFGKEQDDLERELLKIEIEKEKYILSNQERVAKARIREIKDWSEIKERELAQMNGAEIKDVDYHQLISYTKRWIKQSILMGGNGSPAERQNLLGQLRSGIKTCIKLGLLDLVLEGFEGPIQDQIKSEYRV